MRSTISTHQFMFRQVIAAEKLLEESEDQYRSLFQIYNHLISREPKHPAKYNDLRTFNKDFTVFMIQKNNVFSSIHEFDVESLTSNLTAIGALLHSYETSFLPDEQKKIAFNICDLLYAAGYTCLMDMIHDYEVVVNFMCLEKEFELFWRTEKKLVKCYARWASQISVLESLLKTAEIAVDESRSVLHDLFLDFEKHSAFIQFT